MINFAASLDSGCAPLCRSRSVCNKVTVGTEDMVKEKKKHLGASEFVRLNIYKILSMQFCA